ncbi:hypothetical protein Y032_0002g579 [Ancylostoma ceylanicum]|uniref:Uncharacterized protein n=1 Tax=Ancylostoma ceylanicum TaxID=53326 RepID=A0A016VZT3_9BILA|nr:hypothetical protein Y032_0002g579 [Ancylostoma ceylanicum]
MNAWLQNKTCSNLFTASFDWSRYSKGFSIRRIRRIHAHCNLDDDKRQAIMQWVDTCEPLMSPDDDENIGDRPREILSYPLEDIIEQDEESLRDSIRSRCGTDSHPLSILSREDIEKIISTDGTAQEAGSEEDALERAMAASVSSIRSHDILAKLNEDLAVKDVSLTATTATTPSEMDLYRRASQLENYASEKLKELDEERMKKKRGKLLLNCCQNSMMSSGSTVVDWSAIEKRRQAEKEKEELEKRKNELRKRREELKLEADEIRREKEQIDKELNGRSLPSVIARQITQQLQGLSIGSKPNQRSRAPSDSLPTTPTIHKKLISPPVRTPSLTNCAAPTLPSPSHQLKNGHTKAQWIDGMHIRKSSKSRSDRRERKLSEENRREKTAIPSPYAKVTDPRLVDGPPSSGRGSDDAASQCREKKRQSYSASSGYESAAGDYHAAYFDWELQESGMIYRFFLAKYSELQTAIDKGRGRGAAFLGRDTEGLALVFCCGMAPEFSDAGRSRQPEPACTAPVSLPKNAAPRSCLLSATVWNSLYFPRTINHLRKDSRFDKRKVVDKRLGLGREADNLREQQRRLKKELQEAKAIIGQVDDARAICHDTKHSGISQATLVDTLKQVAKKQNIPSDLPCLPYLLVVAVTLVLCVDYTPTLLKIDKNEEIKIETGRVVSKTTEIERQRTQAPHQKHSHKFLSNS